VFVVGSAKLSDSGGANRGFWVEGVSTESNHVRQGEYSSLARLGYGVVSKR
jgi:hypothetical protein